MASQLLTGDLVLCKVGSFAPWPAVVFPQRFLRKDVYRRRRPERVAVCFFNDETYYWDKPSRLRPLTKELVDEFLKQARTSKAEDPVLVKAYQEASNFKSLHEFLLQRLEEEKRIQDWYDNADKDTKIAAGQDPFEGKSGAPRSSSKNTSQHERATSSPSSRSRSRAGAASGPASGPASVSASSSASTSVSASAPASDSTSASASGSRSGSGTAAVVSGRKLARLDHAKRTEISLLLRRKLQTNLVQRSTPPGPEELKESRKLLAKIAENMASTPQFFDLDALRQSKLHKLLKVIANDDNLKEFHGQCTEILDAWKDAISQLRKEKLKLQET
ncbi:LAME_0F19724g1_1 [Lachancea meyersii CBS 8951]|uniref:LAME_0F19724g1_1 n=1 Tax=Lachancea meyersii CBS 8951 TaxID=1266667 RepID=A0A1G4K1P0_9SACH|nr:LAME_0F19724g1_1 [Lachancea meyersii CBS 8951]